MRDKSTHTPGPWAEFNQDGARIFKQWGVQGANGKRVCWVENGPRCDEDARLIAAAPDLLAVCLEIAEHGTDDWDARILTLRAAIAKAEGPSLGEWLMDDKPGRFRSSELGGVEGGAA